MGPSPSNGEPVVIGAKRLLGVVPGEPAAGERKVPDEQKPVMVWPHLLVRHAVAALGVLFLVLLLAWRSTPHCGRSPIRT